jgi:prophage antirepressor-like protein
MTIFYGACRPFRRPCPKKREKVPDNPAGGEYLFCGKGVNPIHSLELTKFGELKLCLIFKEVYMNDLVNFTYEGRKVRTFIKNGEPEWVAKDVAEVLEYPESSLKQLNNLMGHIPEEWKGHNPIMTPSGVQNMLCLSEPGLYFFLGRSDKPAALPFQKWIAGEVIPSIRKTGSYSLPGHTPWKEPSITRLRELRKDLKAEVISVREFRRLAYGLDTPDVPDNPIKGALVFKTYDDFTEYKETHKKANPTVYSFAKTALKITGNPDDFVLIRDLYRLYRENVNSWEAETRNKFVRRIKEMYPELEHKLKKVNGEPEMVFMGCTLAE